MIVKFQVQVNLSRRPTVMTSVDPSPSHLFQPSTSVNTLASTASNPSANNNKIFFHIVNRLLISLFLYGYKKLMNKLNKDI